MEITVTGRHLEITEPIRDYASTKASKLPKYFNRIQAVDIVAQKTDHRQFEVEIKVRADRAKPFVTKVQNTDLYASIDEAVDKLERQLTDHKKRLRNRKGKVSMSGSGPLPLEAQAPAPPSPKKKKQS